MPQFGAVDNAIGVPSIVAGRALPSGAKKVGRGWHARGMVSSCKPGGLLGLGDATIKASTLVPVVLLGGAALLAWKWR